jgi:acetoin utilization protein AcuB
MNTLIKDVMTPTPFTIGDDQPVSRAKHEMVVRGIRHIPVLRGGTCVGLVSDRDLKLVNDIESHRGESLMVNDVCSSDVYTVALNEPVKNVAAHMAETGVGSAVVVNEQEKVVGIFTVTDACRLLSERL